MTKKKIIIVDDHKLFRDGIKLLIYSLKEYEVIGEASDGIEFLDLLENKGPDLVLMDISMPKMDGIKATKKAVEKYPHLKIVALSMFNEQEYYYKLIESGARGFVLKEAGAEELSKAIKSVLNGENYFSQELLRNIILNLSEKNKTKEKIDKLTLKITLREKDVLEQLCTGKTTCEIAEYLHISERTVESHRTNLLSKTNCSNSISLVIFAIKNKLVII
jgi:DNA-binding NarL/FixJ family response regulator